MWKEVDLILIGTFICLSISSFFLLVALVKIILQPRKRKWKREFRQCFLVTVLFTSFLVSQYWPGKIETVETAPIISIPKYEGKAVVEVNHNIPYFSKADLRQKPFEVYQPLDVLGRARMGYALLGPETLPKAERESIGMVKPSGWRISKYDFIDGKYLYNRCHLIAYELSGQNANELNLITGTRQLNVEGMLPYENKVTAYIRKTGHHVLYRVRPLYEGNELVARGVLMEARSIEDGGMGIHFCVFCFNIQKGVRIDYQTGKNGLNRSFA
ncbi:MULTISPECIES: DNA/RNA non-specific endonuclease [Terrabacteria group]|uniref:DNA/RNA non-specific endonuclease n=1 Tax=Bacillati TaxID=1783272 RepID=UPI001C6E5679|nr:MULTISPECIES: DNA/RNA non-specific endonuclease [Terrabacteria group]MBW9212705.1 DNA/RNA non-specific endonuclease [Trueperella sp. zg.1013]